MKNGLIKIMCLMAVLLMAWGIMPAGVLASNEKISAEWDDRVIYDGETLSFDVVVSGISSGSDVEGQITISLDGLKFDYLSPKSYFQMDYTTAGSKVDITITSGTELSYSPNGKLVLCTVNVGTDGEESSFSVSANLNVINGSEVSNVQVSSDSYELKRSRPTPTPSPEPTPEPTAEPTASADASASPDVSASPGTTSEASLQPTAEPTPEVTATPEGINTPLPTKEAEETAAPVATSTPVVTAEPEKKSDDSLTITVGAVIFWVIVGIVIGIWIGLFIGYKFWKKKSVFMTDEEKKIIGR